MDEIRELWKKVRERERDALTDRLTGFFNKSGAERYAGTFCEKGDGLLLVLDLDSFKLVNDLYGHQAGDNVLKAFADILKKRCEDEDILCRIGGDEFLVCINSNLEEGSVASFTEYLNTHIENTCRELMGDDFAIPIGVSVGAVQIPPEGNSYPSLFALADKALYQAKQNGKHGYSIYCKDTDTTEEINPDQEVQRMLTIMSERGTLHGAMTVGQDAFAWIYRYMTRYSIRHETITSICLLVLKKAEGFGDDAFLEAVYQFQEYLQGNLRRNDVILNRRNNMVFLLLPDLSEQSANAFIDRIKNEWSNMNAKSAIAISSFFRTKEGNANVG